MSQALLLPLLAQMRLMRERRTRSHTRESRQKRGRIEKNETYYFIVGARFGKRHLSDSTIGRLRSTYLSRVFLCCHNPWSYSDQ